MAMGRQNKKSRWTVGGSLGPGPLPCCPYLPLGLMGFSACPNDTPLAPTPHLPDRAEGCWPWLKLCLLRESQADSGGGHCSLGGTAEQRQACPGP